MPSQASLPPTRAKRPKRVASTSNSPSSRMTRYQQERLQIIFRTNENPTRKTLEALSDEFDGFPVSKLERWFKDHNRRLGRPRRSVLRGTGREAPSSRSTSSERSLELTPVSTHTELPSPPFSQAPLPHLEAEVWDAVDALLLLHQPVLFA